MRIDPDQTNDMIDSILGKINPKIAGPLEVWKNIEQFTNAERRCYYRIHYFEALKDLGINFLEIEI